jgi:hypothetical protein
LARKGEKSQAHRNVTVFWERLAGGQTVRQPFALSQAKSGAALARVAGQRTDLLGYEQLKLRDLTSALGKRRAKPKTAALAWITTAQHG